MRVRFKKLVPEAVMPTKAHPSDAGFDLVAVSRQRDIAHNCFSYGFGLALEIPEGYVGLVFPRSSVYKQDLVMANCVGVIDSHYRGEIMAKFKPYFPNDNQYNVGERIAQLIIMPYPDVQFEEADKLTDTDRGTGGHGSTGR